jgi:hypothetical protein
MSEFTTVLADQCRGLEEELRLKLSALTPHSCDGIFVETQAALLMLSTFRQVVDQFMRHAETLDGRCATCRWWEFSGNEEWGGCLLADGDQERPPQPDGREQLASGCGADSNYGAGLATRHDFGCIQWQPKQFVSTSNST